jgi:hypothetical protein
MHYVKYSIEIVHTFGPVRVGPDDLAVSFVAVSLFIRVPLVKSLKVFSQHFSENIPALFRHALYSTYFSSGGKFYEETEGVSMGSPLFTGTSL